jgi:hypothetical protein
VSGASLKHHLARRSGPVLRRPNFRPNSGTGDEFQSPCPSREREYRHGARENVLLEVDQAYYEVLGGQAVLRVAQQTVKDRQLVSDQVAALAGKKVRPDMDVSFADVDLA